MSSVPESLPVSLLVPSCDRYAYLWEPFWRGFAQFWPDCPFPRFLGVNAAAPTFPGVTVLRTGEDRNYAANLAFFLQQVPSDYVLFWIDDRFLINRVNTPELLALVREGIARRVDYLKLIPEHPYFYASSERRSGPIPRRTQYRASFTIALWRRQALLDLLSRSQDAWQLEAFASRDSNASPAEYYGLSPAFHTSPPIDHVHLISKGRIMRDALPYLRATGLLDAWPFLSIESRREYAGRVGVGRLYSWLWWLADARLRYSHRDAPASIL